MNTSGDVCVQVRRDLVAVRRADKLACAAVKKLLECRRRGEPLEALADAAKEAATLLNRLHGCARWALESTAEARASRRSK
jgi:hypothetical protein